MKLLIFFSISKSWASFNGYAGFLNSGSLKKVYIYINNVLSVDEVLQPNPDTDELDDLSVSMSMQN